MSLVRLGEKGGERDRKRERRTSTVEECTVTVLVKLEIFSTVMVMNMN